MGYSGSCLKWQKGLPISKTKLLRVTDPKGYNGLISHFQWLTANKKSMTWL